MSQGALGNWQPNFIFLADNGTGPDTVAGDRIWSARFEFAPGALLQYRYTIGSPGDRGYTVPVDETFLVRIRDIFADRPVPSGTLGPNTVITVEAAPVPDPSAMLLLGTGLACLWGARKRLKK